ncbi:MAG: NnrS family protein [Candidatus Omnitrophica bacterium]|nr:NnrS family protein [Candidatus Omnitrophota bacterium]
MHQHWLLIQREPFRLFFPLGVLFGVIGTGHWLVYGVGWSGSYSGYYHASVQVKLYLGAFVGGFLMTAIPRFASAPHAGPKEVSGVLLGMLLNFVFLIQKAWLLSDMAYAAWLVLLFSFIVRRFLNKGRAANPPAEFVWIPVAFLHAATGIVMMALSQHDLLAPRFLGAGRVLVEQGFVLSLVLGIGGFLGPRLMGLHQLPTPAMMRKPQDFYKRRLAAHLLLGFFLLVSFLWEARPSLFLRAAVVTLELACLGGVLAPPRVPGIFQRFLWFSFWSVLAGVWLAALFPAQRATMLHFLFLGGFSLMTFLVSTMVVLSHSGHGDKLGRPLWIYWVIFIGIAAALAVRVTASLAPEHYFLHVGIASAIWILTGAAWLLFAAPYLGRVPSDGEWDSPEKCGREG